MKFPHSDADISLQEEKVQLVPDFTHLLDGSSNSTFSQISAEKSEHVWILHLSPKGAHTSPTVSGINLLHSVLESYSHEDFLHFPLDESGTHFLPISSSEPDEE